MIDFALFIVVPSLTGLFILSATAFILAGIVLFIMFCPDPLDISKKILVYKKKFEKIKSMEKEMFF
ncbi:hypothetical protein [Bacillus mycoides]|uniref:hypothetical protein n=1 Tax=Bacillus mycoides TaxID=1405 RepID=UPI003D1D2AC7